MMRGDGRGGDVQAGNPPGRVRVTALPGAVRAD
jgi:hypothetical protein